MSDTDGNECRAECSASVNGAGYFGRECREEHRNGSERYGMSCEGCGIGGVR